MKTKKNFGLIIVASMLCILVYLLFSCLYTNNAYAKDSNEITFSFNESNGQLTIKGDALFQSSLSKNDMKDMDEGLEEKFHCTRDAVKSIIIERVNKICENTLCNFKNLESISIDNCESTRSNVKSDAIMNNPKLANLTIIDYDFNDDSNCIHDNPLLKNITLVETRGGDDWVSDRCNIVRFRKAIICPDPVCKEDVTNITLIYRYYGKEKERRHYSYDEIDSVYDSDQWIFDWIRTDSVSSSEDIKFLNKKANVDEDRQSNSIDFYFDKSSGLLTIEGSNVSVSTLQHCDMQECDSLLKSKDCNRDAVKKIKITKINYFDGGTLNNFKNVEEIKISRCKSTMTHFDSNTFDNNPSLEKLYIEDFVMDSKFDTIDNCPRLQEITFDYVNHWDDCKKYTNNDALKRLIKMPDVAFQKYSYPKVTFNVSGDHKYHNEFQLELCHCVFTDKWWDYWFDQDDAALRH